MILCYTLVVSIDVECEEKDAPDADVFADWVYSAIDTRTQDVLPDNIKIKEWEVHQY